MISRKLQDRLAQLRRIMLDISHIDPLIKSRKRDVVTVRMMVAHTLYEEGATEPQIGRLLGITASTVHHYKDRFLALYVPGWEAERELYNRFKAAYEKEDADSK